MVGRFIHAVKGRGPIRKLYIGFWWLITHIVYKQKFGAIGNKSALLSPLQLDSTTSVFLGNGVYINHGAWLMGNAEKTRTLTIDDGTVIGHFAHIIAMHSIHIGPNVLVADKVFISDCTHEYAEPTIPIIQQPVRLLNPVSVGEGSWLGENVCILGASVGKHCVIGANSVVTKDVPDYCVAAGNPAKVIKKYDTELRTWIKAC